MREEKNWFDEQQKQEQYRSGPELETGRSGGAETLILAFTAVCGVILIGSIVLYGFIFFTRPELSGTADTGLFTGIVGPLVLWFGVLRFAAEWASTAGCRRPVTATVTEILLSEGVSGRSSSKYTIYTPVYGYELDGQQILVRSRGENRSRDKYQVGQQVEMLVSPGQPKKYCIRKESAPVLIINLLYILAGLPATGAAIWVWAKIFLGMV